MECELQPFAPSELIQHDEVEVAVRAHLAADLVSRGIVVGAVGGVAFDRAHDLRERLHDDAGVMPAILRARLADQHQTAGWNAFRIADRALAADETLARFSVLRETIAVRVIVDRKLAAEGRRGLRDHRADESGAPRVGARRQLRIARTLISVQIQTHPRPAILSAHFAGAL